MQSIHQNSTTINHLQDCTVPTSNSICSTNENSPNEASSRQEKYRNLNNLLDKIHQDELFRYAKQELQVYEQSFRQYQSESAYAYYIHDQKPR
jgi:hypothetical protein